MIVGSIVGGLLLLAIGGEGLVRGGIGLAQSVGVSKLFVGVVFVSIGTSAPELIVSIQAVLASQPELAVGNVIGSNISNILLVLAIGAILRPMLLSQEVGVWSVAVLVAASAFVVWLVLPGQLTGEQGLIMLGLLALYILSLFFSGRRRAAAEQAAEVEGAGASSALTNIVFFLAGAVALAFGARLLVDGAEELAKLLGVSEVVIGLTVIAVGTSLPELAATIVAAARRHSEVVAGNIIGSGIFNILGILGAAAYVSVTYRDVALPIPSTVTLDTWIMLGVAVLMLPFVLTNAKFGRLVGLLFLIGYGGYVYSLYTM